MFASSARRLKSSVGDSPWVKIQQGTPRRNSSAIVSVDILPFQLLNVRVLAPPEDLDPIEAEIVEKPAEREPRSVQVRGRNRPQEPLPSVQAPNTEVIMLLEIKVNQIQNGKLVHRYGLCSWTFSTSLRTFWSSLSISSLIAL